MRWHGATAGKLINQKLRMLQAAKPCPLTKAVIRDAPLQVVQAGAAAAVAAPLLRVGKADAYDVGKSTL